MESLIGEFLKLLFQPPVMILFCLAVAGFSMMLRDRSDHLYRVHTEWRVRQSFYKRDLGFSNELIARARKRFYQQHRVKEPKQ